MWPFSPAYPELAVEQLQDGYDYIVVGDGTAGCVLANRLSTSPSNRVLVIERGPVADAWTSRVPMLSTTDGALDQTVNHKRTTVAQKELIGQDRVKGTRVMELHTGDRLGGTSRVNLMLYTRGLPAEYDAWEEKEGLKGWGWESLKPYFLKSEKASEEVVGVHSRGGVWKNRIVGDLFFRGFRETLEAAISIGLPYVPDVNSPTHPPFGCARLHSTVDENGQRHSTYHAFLPKALAQARRDHLHVCTNTIVERLETQKNPKGEVVVTGIVLSPRLATNGVMKSKYVKVRKEVVLSAGAFGSPHILMLSGIGPAEHLKEHGITVVKDLPAVGSNFQDHFAVSVGFHNSLHDSLLKLQRQPWLFLIELIRYLIWGTGLLLMPVLQMAIFTNTKLLDVTGAPTKTEKTFDEKLPDVEITPMVYDTSDSSKSSIRIASRRGWGTYSFLIVHLAPRSHGTVRLSSPDPRAPLVIDPAFLSNAADIVPLRAAVKLALRLRDAMRKSGYKMEDATVPRGESDEELEDWIRRSNRSSYHYSSTCRMGRLVDKSGEWEGAVVDERLRVYGVKGLRIADASVFPWVPRTHTQTPTVAIAEKCADMILKGE